jgi:hypothetical protein
VGDEARYSRRITYGGCVPVLPDVPGGAAATAVVVELNGATVPAAVAAPGFVDGFAVVTVAGLTPGTPYSLRCRCELEDPEVDPYTLWSPPVAVVTLDLAGLEVWLRSERWVFP